MVSVFIALILGATGQKTGTPAPNAAASVSAAAAAVSAANASASATAASVSAASAASAAALSGDVAFFDTYLAASTAVGGLAADQVVNVLADETRVGRSSLYRKESGVLAFKSHPGLTDATSNSGAGAALRQAPRNSVFVQVGDSNTDNVAGRPGWQTAVNYEWKAEGGPFEGWTDVNLGQNGIELAGWVNSIATGDAETLTTTRGSAWAAVNNSPDVIVVSLGTNDLNSAAKRASGVGTEANLRANLATLINFFLSNSSASVVLRMPQPLACIEFLAGIPGWADADDCHEANRRLRLVHREWIGKSDRVEVYDSHKHLFADNCDDILTECLDPEGASSLLADALHLTEIGYRRMAEDMARQFKPDLRRNAQITVTPEAVTQTALWAATLWVQRSGSSLDVAINPQGNYAGAATGTLGNHSRPVGMKGLDVAEGILRADRIANYKQILAAGTAAGGPSLSLWVWFQRSGNIYQADKATLSQLVTATDPDYAQITLTNVTPSYDAADTAGPVTFFVKDRRALPFAPVLADMVVRIGHGQTTASYPIIPVTAEAITSIYATRAVSTGGLVIELRAANQVDGRWVNGGTWNTGKRIATIDFSAGYLKDPTITWDTTDFPSGVYLTRGHFLKAFVTSGTVSGDATIVVGWR